MRSEVVHIEQSIGVFSEDALQRLALHSHGVVRFLNGYYLFAHFSVTILFFGWLFVRRPDGYASCRRILIAMTAMGLGIHAIYPLAPPRMLPDLGLIDTGRLFGLSPYGDAQEGLANQFAAMPSLHFGWALLVGWGALRYGRRRTRAVMMLHPFLTLAAIIITANHYWLDAVVALGLFATAMRLDSWFQRRHTARARSATAAANPEDGVRDAGVDQALVEVAEAQWH